MQTVDLVDLKEKNEFCKNCGTKLTFDEIAFHKKLFSRNAKDFFCLKCCGEYFDISTEILQKKLLQFKQSGCTLFLKNN